VLGVLCVALSGVGFIALAVTGPDAVKIPQALISTFVPTAPENQNSGILSTPTVDVVPMETLVPTVKVIPTETHLPSMTPTITLTPTPTAIPTPKGITDLGYLFWSLSKDLGFTIDPRPLEEMGYGEQSAWPFWLYSDDGVEQLYIDDSFSGGFQVDKNANIFLMISYGMVWSTYEAPGLAFSIYRDRIAPVCQGNLLEYGPIKSYVAECMRIAAKENSAFHWPDAETDENGITWDPIKAYPISPDQALMLESKYSLKTYPEQYIIFASEAPMQ